MLLCKTRSTNTKVHPFATTVFCVESISLPSSPFPRKCMCSVGCIVCELGRLCVKLLAGVVYVKLHCHVRKNVFLSLTQIAGSSIHRCRNQGWGGAEGRGWCFPWFSVCIWKAWFTIWRWCQHRAASVVNLKLFSTIWLVGRWRTLRCWCWNRTCFYFSISMCWQHSLTLLDLFEVWRPTRCWRQRHIVNQA